MAFKAREFLLKIDRELLLKYFTKKNIFDAKDVRNLSPQELEDKLLLLPDNIQKIVFTDFENIEALSSESGILCLIETAKSFGQDISSEIEPLVGYNEQALTVLLDHSDDKIFDYAVNLNMITDLKSSVHRSELAKIDDPTFLEGKADDLANAVRSLLNEEGRAKKCTPDVYKYEDRIVYILYPEDYTKVDIHYNKLTGNLERFASKPVMRIIYIYYFRDGHLELNTHFKRKKKGQLLNLFNRVVLNDETELDQYQLVYDLEKIYEPNFAFTTDPIDLIEYVFLKEIRLNSKFSIDRQLTIRLDRIFYLENGLKDMFDHAQSLNINTTHYQLTQVVLKVKFSGKGNRGISTVKITHPDGCTLSDSDNDKKIKNYLEKWGLVKKYEEEQSDPK